MGTPHYLLRPIADAADLSPGVSLPYGLSGSHVVTAINDIYSYLHAVNSAAALYGYPRVEDIIQPASFSGLLSELVCRAFVHATAAAMPGLVRNTFPNGRPDLVPRGIFVGDSILHGNDGIEVKVSRHRTSVQGHNVESGWIMVVWITADLVAVPVYDRAPTFIDRVAVAQLEETDWTFSGRSPTSRRTPTASINVSGRAKLDAGTVYDRTTTV
ncbi:MAG: hypothetical protein ABSE70_11455 [Candidatus Limnocylindrales bacterium]